MATQCPQCRFVGQTRCTCPKTKPRAKAGTGRSTHRFSVSMHDTFMSGWGPATGKKDMLVVHGLTEKQADTIARNARQRPEMKAVKIHHAGGVPTFPRRHVSLKRWRDLSGPWVVGHRRRR